MCTNAKHVVVTGKKAQQKKYYSHSQYPGGLKVEPYERVKERNVDKVSVLVFVLSMSTLMFDLAFRSSAMR